MSSKTKKKESLKEFLARKEVRISPQVYFLDALSSMAFGLFASLLIGTIFTTLGERTGVEVFNTIAAYAKSAIVRPISSARDLQSPAISFMISSA